MVPSFLSFIFFAFDAALVYQAARLDKNTHRPSSLDELTYHDAISDRLRSLAKSGELPHMLFYGPPGAGKRTRVNALLTAIYGKGVQKVKWETRTIVVGKSKKKVQVLSLGSKHHVEINPSQSGNNDRHVVQEVVKEIARYRPLNASDHPFKVVVMTEVDSLSKDAQHGLRRTMEKYSSSCRIIMICENFNKLVAPLHSRCLAIRVPAPKTETVFKVLNDVCKAEGAALPERLANRIVEHSQRNLRRALLTLEACKVAKFPFAPDQPIVVPDWQRFLANLALEITREQSPQKLQNCRAQLYELLANCIPPEIILAFLARELSKKVDTQLKVKIAEHAAYYEHRMRMGQKPIFHLEAFIAKFMALYKRYLVDLFA